MSGTKVSGVTRDRQTEELAKVFPHLCRSKLVLCEDVDAVLRKLQPVYQELLAKYSKAIQTRMVQDALPSLLRLSLPQEVGQRWTLKAVGDMVVKVVEHHRQMAATMEQGSDGEGFANFEDSFERGNHLPDVLLDADIEQLNATRVIAGLQPLQTKGNSAEGSNAAQTAVEQAAAVAEGKQPMDMATEFDASIPGSMAHEAVKQRLADDFEKMSLFMFHAGLKRGKVLGAEVSFPRPERLEKGGKPPAEFHARADQLGQFAIDWLYQAQLWVQAEGFTPPVAKIVTYLHGGGMLVTCLLAPMLQFKVAFLQRFVKPVFHTIPLKEGAEPPPRRAYRLSRPEKDEIDKQVKGLLAKGYIQPKASPYGSPIIFVAKGDGTLRVH